MDVDYVRVYQRDESGHNKLDTGDDRSLNQSECPVISFEPFAHPLKIGWIDVELTIEISQKIYKFCAILTPFVNRPNIRVPKRLENDDLFAEMILAA